MTDSHVADVLRAYKARYDALSLDRRIADITIFKITDRMQAPASNILTRN